MRWRTRLRRIVCLGSSLALCALEVLVNLDLSPEFLPRDHVAMEMDIPGGVSVAAIDESALPADWRDKAQWPAFQALGNAWLDARTAAILRVSSAVIPLEGNLLLNPAYPDAACVRIVAMHPFFLLIRASWTGLGTGLGTGLAPGSAAHPGASFRVRG